MKSDNVFLEILSIIKSYFLVKVCLYQENFRKSLLANVVLSFYFQIKNKRMYFLEQSISELSLI